jgi:RimJ/RimL family protein N-acetyltransferase
MPHTLGAGDEARLERFLARHAPTSMFLRSNSRRAGLVDRGEPFQGTYVAELDGDEIVGVVCHGWNGMVLLQAPVGLQALVRAAAQRSGRAVEGLVGPWAQVVAARAALGLADAPTRLDRREDLFTLDLGALRVPPPLADGRVRCRRATADDVPLLADWRYGYELETIGREPGEATRRIADDGVRAGVAAGTQWILEHSGDRVATSTFNATLPDMVQIGGVWTPPPLRGRGYARSVVAGSLQHALRDGVRRSILFTGAENEPARRAYLALGYENVGDYGIVLFQGEP